MPSVPPLWRRLIDDAAVFPPGNAPLDVAIRHHHVHRTASYAACIGPLLVPVSAANVVVAQVNSQRSQLPDTDDGPLPIGLIARPGVATVEVEAAVHSLSGSDAVRVTQVELAWSEEWRSLDVGDLPRVLEVPREVTDAIDDVDAGRRESSAHVLAKFRTGPTPTWPWPDEAELAAFIYQCAAAQVPFKLTGGLHHAVRGEHDGEPQHGLLNVLIATFAAQNDGDLVAVESLLAQRDSTLLADAVGDLDDDQIEAVRELFTAYGCCEVTDPITELTALGLLNLDPEGPHP